LATVPRPAGVQGQNAGGDLGAAMIAEGYAYPVIVQFPYSAKPTYAGLEVGRRYPISYLLGPEVLEPLGTTFHKRRLVWHSLRALSPSANNSIASLLYDSNLVGLPPIS